MIAEQRFAVIESSGRTVNKPRFLQQAYYYGMLVSSLR